MGTSKGDISKMGLTFQVAGVKKPLMSVSKIVDNGNRVCFGPSVADNFIEHLDSKTKIPLARNGKGSYLLNVDFLNGRSTSITVDSGAEDSVCPPDWGKQFLVQQGSAKLLLILQHHYLL